MMFGLKEKGKERRTKYVFLVYPHEAFVCGLKKKKKKNTKNILFWRVKRGREGEKISQPHAKCAPPIGSYFN